MSFDGEYQTEYPRDTGYFDSVEDAWEYGDDMGSRWFFYPFYFVVSESGNTIKDAPDMLKFLEGKRVSTVAKLFYKLFELVEEKELNLDVYEYAWALEDYQFTGQLP
jgi:hypothetical protein